MAGLVLTRRIGERLLVRTPKTGHLMVITIVQARGGACKLAFSAPREQYEVLREEIAKPLPATEEGG